MLKNILKLDGAQELSKSKQKEINGGAPVWCGYCQCEYSLVYACGNSKYTACLNVCNA